MRVALTRAEEDIRKDKPIFERASLKVVELPLIEEVPLDFEVPDEEFDYLVFLSPRAVRSFLSRHSPKGSKIVAVGEKTKRAVEEFGYEVWAMPENYYGESILKLMAGKGGKVLLPRSHVGREEVIEGLRALGFEVHTLSVYTVRPMIYHRDTLIERLNLADAIFFASPSAVEGLLANLPKEEASSLLAGKIILCIGKTTKEHLYSKLSLQCLTPEKPTVEGVVSLLKSLARSLH